MRLTRAELEEEVRRLEARCAELEDQLGGRPKAKPKGVHRPDLAPGAPSAYRCKKCDLHDPRGGAAPPMSRNWYCRWHLSDALEGKQ